MAAETFRSGLNRPLESTRDCPCRDCEGLPDSVAWAWACALLSGGGWEEAVAGVELELETGSCAGVVGGDLDFAWPRVAEGVGSVETRVRPSIGLSAGDVTIDGTD